ncbi:fatty-acid-binding protein 1-like [Zingiber officinale]|uniref:Chalcone isomerase domain-containing protein n=1 Tax=Zingiber officinale TaxID=94328 RepID=A0A8J5HWC1_ZINOF|nr:fatty-acid-binding protein 1-like [Zingiber officinale]KAG6536992.1 hypothetical protein ZIOFF_002070 [Zingiber officinale]
MGSLRFPFPFPPPEKPPPDGLSFRRVAVTITAAAAVAAGAGLTLSASLKQSAAALRKPCNDDDASHLWAASVSLDGGPQRPAMYVDPKSNVEFPMVIEGEKRLLSVGTRLWRPYFNFGSIRYVFGVYADGFDVKRLSKKYGSFSASELKVNKDFIADILDQDLRITIIFKKARNNLSMRSLRYEFQKYVGESLRKFSGSDSKELLQRFTSLLRDDYKITKESFLEVSRDHGHVLQVRFNGKEVGKIPSKLLCKAMFDAHFGPDAFDKDAREEVKSRLISMLHERSDR